MSGRALKESYMQKEFFNGRVIVKVGDITEENVDGIVNAANSTLLGGGGVDGAIHYKGGKQILDECRKIRETEYPKGLPTNTAVITSGGKLKAKYVIHTVGPIYGNNQGKDAGLLAACYKGAINMAASKNLTRIAFPSISTGAFGYPKAEAAIVVSKAVRESLDENPGIEEVRLIFFSAEDADVFMKHAGFL